MTLTYVLKHPRPVEFDCVPCTDINESFDLHCDSVKIEKKGE